MMVQTGGAAGLGAVSMTGAFGTLTFDDDGIDNLYAMQHTADVIIFNNIGAVSLTLHMTQQMLRNANLCQLHIQQRNGIHINCFRRCWLEHQTFICCLCIK